jgi:hypothetical protein
VIRLLQEFDAYRRAPCRTLTEVKAAAEATLDRLSPRQQLSFSFGLLGAVEGHVQSVHERFLAAGEPPLSQFAPYAELALRIELFYHLAVHKGRMSPAHRMDMLYLFYVPFCNFFVSGDWVHRDCAPLFMRADQHFVSGPELKKALGDFNASMALLGDEQRSLSIPEIAPYPPLDGNSLLTKLWDRYHAAWRTRREATWRDVPEWLSQSGPLNKLPDESLSAKTPDAIMRVRAVRQKKGSWWQVPKNLRRTTSEN